MAIAVAVTPPAWRSKEVDAMSAAVAAVPPGANRGQMGEALRIASEKTGMSAEEIRGHHHGRGFNVPPFRKRHGQHPMFARRGKQGQQSMQTAINSLSGRRSASGC
ncbi:MAG: hypothetical protein IPJ61_21655, partial [Tessaracoccus sp.]|uniref:hypothetical protein n=1 Tax=Tessaracoccus sp. TaxID=1971211 RepID=UPI001EBF5D41